MEEVVAAQVLGVRVVGSFLVQEGKQAALEALFQVPQEVEVEAGEVEEQADDHVQALVDSNLIRADFQNHHGDHGFCHYA